MLVYAELKYCCHHGEIEFKFHPRVRKVDRETEEEIAQHLKFNANRKLVQQSYKEKTGKKIILKDIHNIATRFKATEEPVSRIVHTKPTM